ncbi:chymotrypsin-2-like [Phlebotomus argentipes]|uniref:chymotrypsin-2-like n=1 Tax=Phlebotomus argentipes TaxID=94469 RepID=UPI0028936DED|nr:chymotrypsin-2-like [Phlebotomus argentipes]
MAVGKFVLLFLIPLTAKCALISATAIDLRIVGGYSAAPGQFPYQVSIQTPEYVHDCGGSIVSASWILTSAVCARTKVVGESTAVVGSHLISDTGSRYDLERIEIHPDYSSKAFQHDVGLMKTATLIVFTDLVQPIRIATTKVMGDIEAIASGWGTLAYPGAQADNLQYLPVTIIDNELCSTLHTSTNAAKLHSGAMCAQPVRGTGMCVGDTGSPLVTKIASGYVQIGVVSWGVPCGANYPDVYTRLSSYSDWIANTSDAFFIEKMQ